MWQQEIIHLGKPTTIDIDMHITIDNKSRMLKLVSHQKKGEWQAKLSIKGVTGIIYTK